MKTTHRVLRPRNNADTPTKIPNGKLTKEDKEEEAVVTMDRAISPINIETREGTATEDNEFNNNLLPKSY